MQAHKVMAQAYRKAANAERNKGNTDKANWCDSVARQYERAKK